MVDTIPATMLAYRCRPGKLQPSPERINVPSLTHDQVLVKILAGGVCHTDLPLFDPDSDIQKLLSTGETDGFTAGHEGAGNHIITYSMRIVLISLCRCHSLSRLGCTIYSPRARRWNVRSDLRRGCMRQAELL